MSNGFTPADRSSGSSSPEPPHIGTAAISERIHEPDYSHNRPLEERDEEDAHLLEQTSTSIKIRPHEPGMAESGDSGVQRNGRSRDLFIQTGAEGGTARPLIDETEQVQAAKEKPVTWLSLPRKDQLAVLTLARLSEPLTQTSLGSYIFYQLRSFDPSLPDSTIAYQAGILHAAFPGAQFLTAIAWGRFADAEYGGRKRAISIGLLGTMVSTIGFGFSHSFVAALLFRCLGGVLNGVRNSRYKSWMTSACNV